jgi:hypothetical protein
LRPPGNRLVVGRRLRRFYAGLLALIGASFIATPEFFIATMWIVPWYLLTLLQLAGVTIIVFGVRNVRPIPDMLTPPYVEFAAPLFLARLMILIVRQIRTSGSSLYNEVRRNYPILSAPGCAGLITVIAASPGDGSATRLFFRSVALAPALALTPLNWLVAHVSPASAGHETYELSRKIAEHWLPFILIFPRPAP